MITCFKTFVLCLLMASPAAAQNPVDMSEADYKKMMQDMMKSGNNYAQSQAQSWDARLKVVAGSVMVKTSDAKEWSRITGEMPLDPNDLVKTGSDGLAELYIDDKGAISLDRNTEVEISSLEQEDAVFSLNFGALVAKVKHFLNEKHKLSVRTPSAVCAIRGTEFAVEYSQMSKDTAAAVFDEGSVAVALTADSGKETQEFLLEKNTEIVLNPAKKRFRAVALFRMGRHRGTLGKVRKRLVSLKGWKPSSEARRRQLRDRALKRKVIRKQLKKSKISKPVKRRAGSRYRAVTQ